MKPIMGVYAIFNSLNRKCYIGSSKNIQRRTTTHFSNLKHNRHSNSYLQNAWNKYGGNNFFAYTIQECHNIKLLEHLELKHILDKQSNKSDKGYNLTTRTSSAALYAEKISKTKKSLNAWKGKNNPMYGTNIEKYWTKKYGKEYAIKRINEVKEINSLKNSGSNNAMFNEKRLDLTEFNKKNKSKKVAQFDLNNNFIKEWESVSTAAKTLNLTRRSLANFINSSNGYACKFIWKYI